MTTPIKLILRALLPLLFIGANRIGQHIARPHFIPDGAAVRVEVLFPRIFALLLPYHPAHTRMYLLYKPTS